MQVKAILKAACNLTKRGIKVITEIEIPLVGHELELKTLREIVEETADKVFAEGNKGALLYWNNDRAS